MSDKQDQYSALSYGTFLRNRLNFKQAGTRDGSDFNIYDTPSQKYFKIFFYFWNGDIDGFIEKDSYVQSGGLLAPMWQLFQSKDNSKSDYTDKNYWKYTTAWTYLKLNGEDERADLLQNFVELLSNINSESPWYFQQIEGLGEALDRPQTMKNDFIFEETRKKITLKCLQDAYDDRISTLLDLYKAIVWSWQTKRVILPANLRKFDMGVYIFETPIKNIHNPDKQSFLTKPESDFATIDKRSSQYLTSYKYIEFHNCEIDYNAAHTGFATLDNIEGSYPVHTIDIYFDDCYETRYNEFMMKDIGDMIHRDSVVYDYSLGTGVFTAEGAPQKPKKHSTTELEARSTMYQSVGPVTNAAKELIGFGTSWLKSKAKHIVLGNMHGLSISKVKDQVDAMTSGHLWSTVSAVKQYTDNKKRAKTKYVDYIGNIFKAKTSANNI